MIYLLYKKVSLKRTVFDMQDKNKEMRMVLYHSENDDVAVNAVIKDETLRITQKAMAELFNADKSTDWITLAHCAGSCYNTIKAVAAAADKMSADRSGTC